MTSSNIKLKCWVCHFVFEPELMSVSKPGIVPLLLSSRPDIHNSQTTKMKKSTQGKIWKRAVIGIFNNIIPPFQRQKKTRLTYNCAHLRLNNKKNKNELSQKGPRDWALIFEKSDLTNFLAIPKFLGWKFSCVNFFFGEIFGARIFWGEILLGWKIFLVKIFLAENFFGWKFF